MASSWKNFQSYSVIVVKARKRKKLFTTCFKKRFANQMSFLLCWDLNRAESVKLSWAGFPSWRGGHPLITSVDAALAAQNMLLAAESLGYGGVMIGMLRYCSEEVAELFRLPDYTYPVFGIALGVPNQHAETTFAIGAGCFWRRIPEERPSGQTAYDKVQADLCWSAQQIVGAWASCSPSSSTWTVFNQNY